MRIAAIIPVGTLEGAKTRLGGTLDAEERHDLVEELLARTVASALAVARLDDVLVISPDPEVLTKSAEIGARTLRQRTKGLNAGLAEARADVIAGGAEAILVLPIDLAHIEPFDAYVLRSAGIATIAIAVIGLIASLFVPMAYCHYGCPTGALLNFIRSHGRIDGFGRREVAAGLLLAFAILLSWKYHAIHAWMVAFA